MLATAPPTPCVRQALTFCWLVHGRKSCVAVRDADLQVVPSDTGRSCGSPFQITTIESSGLCWYACSRSSRPHVQGALAIAQTDHVNAIFCPRFKRLFHAFGILPCCHEILHPLAIPISVSMSADLPCFDVSKKGAMQHCTHPAVQRSVGNMALSSLKCSPSLHHWYFSFCAQPQRLHFLFRYEVE